MAPRKRPVQSTSNPARDLGVGEHVLGADDLAHRPGELGRHHGATAIRGNVPPRRSGAIDAPPTFDPRPTTAMGATHTPHAHEPRPRSQATGRRGAGGGARRVRRVASAAMGAADRDTDAAAIADGDGLDVYTSLRHGFADRLDADFIRSPDGEHPPITYADVDRRTAQVANALRALGVGARRPCGGAGRQVTRGAAHVPRRRSRRCGVPAAQPRVPA